LPGSFTGGAEEFSNATGKMEKSSGLVEESRQIPDRIGSIAVLLSDILSHSPDFDLLKNRGLGWRNLTGALEGPDRLN